MISREIGPASPLRRKEQIRKFRRTSHELHRRGNTLPDEISGQLSHTGKLARQSRRTSWAKGRAAWDPLT